MRLLRTLLESPYEPDEPPHTNLIERLEEDWADALAPGVPALAELLVVDTSVPSQAKGKQPMGQPPSGQVDRAALQLDAAYLLEFVLSMTSSQVEPQHNLTGWKLRARHSHKCTLLCTG